MTSPKCASVQDRLVLYLEGELDPAQTADVEQHLAVCADCRKVLKEEKALTALLAELPQAPEGSILVRTLSAKERLCRRARLVRRLAGAAAAILILCAGLWVLRAPRSEPDENAVIANLPVLEEMDALVQAGAEDLLDHMEIVEAVYELSLESYSDQTTFDQTGPDDF